MTNQLFLSRWPSGSGTGYIGFSHKLRKCIRTVGPSLLLAHHFEVVPVKVSNTGSLTNGSVEAWTVGDKVAGPFFLSERSVFDTEAEAAADINHILQRCIEYNLHAIAKLQDEIRRLESGKVSLT
jgi:hypothetical protein